MNSDIIHKINSKYAKMSKGQKVLSAYITDCLDEAAFLTAAKLGEKVGISESTVVRYAGFLGYKGYPEFQNAMKDMVRMKLKNKSDERISYSNVEGGEVLAKVLMADGQRIQETLEKMDGKTFGMAEEIILGADRIYVLGVRDSHPLAEILASHLSKMFDDVYLLGGEPPNTMFEKIMHIREDDIVIALSFPRYSMSTLKALEYANDRKAKVITITDSIHSPMNLYSSCNLVAVSDMSSFFESLTAPLSLINALILDLGIKRKEKILEAFEITDEFFRDYPAGNSDDIEYLKDNIKFRLV